MRRIVGFVLLGLAAFCLVLAPFAKWYAYPKLALVPLNQTSTSLSLGHDMTYFDQGSLAEAHSNLTSTIRVIGDVKAADTYGHNVAVWDKSTVTTNSDGSLVSADTTRSAFNRFTGAAVNCCGESADKLAVHYKGQVFKFPFNTQKKTYEWWDEDLQAAAPMTFAGVEDVDGTRTYKFHQVIKPTKIAQVKVPSKVVGAGTSTMVSADRYHATDRTFWIEPETGAIVKAVEKPNDTLRYKGEDRVVLTRGTSGFDAATIKDNADYYGSKGLQLHLLRLAPMLGLIIGLLALIAAAIVLLVPRQQTDSFHAKGKAKAEPTPEAP
jgi:Porin PorA